jgi:predicted transcriptional regulator
MAELQQGGRRGALSRVRAEIAHELVVRRGVSLATAARHLGVSTTAVSKILRKVDG